MEAKDNTEYDSTSSIIEVVEGDMSIVHGSMQVDGNLEVNRTLTTRRVKLIDDSLTTLIDASNKAISFKKSCEFLKPVEFNNGETIIGVETTYNSAYVGSPTIQAGERLVVGDSLFKIDANDREVIAPAFTFTELKKVIADSSEITTQTSNMIEVNKLKVNTKEIANEIVSDLIKSVSLQSDNITALNLNVKNDFKAFDIISSGSIKVENGVTIMGIDTNGAALTVNRGEIVANQGIVSHTSNNLFQCLRLIGSGNTNDVCFRIDPGVNSLIEGDVTIQNSNLVLDKSNLVSDNVTVTQLAQFNSNEPTTGIQLTTENNWTSYSTEMVGDVPVEKTFDAEDYNPYETVDEAVARNKSNYESVGKTVKSLITPIKYIMEQSNPNVPKQFSIKPGVYRIDSRGNALLKNVISETGRFSDMSVHDLKVNKIELDKVVATSVASNVVDTDNLLKSRGIAEFDGVVNTSADIFVEKDSSINVASGSNVVFQSGAELTIADGAKFNMSPTTSINLGGKVEIDISKLVFVDSTTGLKYRIAFRDATGCEGSGVVMEYYKVEDTTSSEEVASSTDLSATKLDETLSALGV